MVNSPRTRVTVPTSGRRGVSPWWRLGVLTLAGVLVASGCGSQFMETMDHREKVVVFKDGTPRRVQLKVREACSDVPRSTPAPLPSNSEHKATRMTRVRFRVDDAGQRDIAELYECLRRFDAVAGIQRD